MKRTKTFKIVTAIITADLHLSGNTPSSRIDDYTKAQRRKLTFLKELQVKHGCPILDAGDIFNSSKSPPYVESFAYIFLPDNIITIPGNHDLPKHSLDLYHESSLALLENVGKIIVLRSPEDSPHCASRVMCVYGIPFGQYGTETDSPYFKPDKQTINVLLIHEMVFPKGKPPWPGAEGFAAEEILKMNPEFDLIVTGHNHNAFVVEKDGRLLVNPGSMLRQSIDKEDYEPRCYLYYADENKVVPVYYPIEENVFSVEEKKAKEEKRERLAAYIERMNMEWEVGLSFRRNLEDFLNKNDVSRRVREVIWASLPQT